jgi:hypothetical protein
MRRRPCRRPVISLCNIVLHLLVRHTALLRRLSSHSAHSTHFPFSNRFLEVTNYYFRQHLLQPLQPLFPQEQPCFIECLTAAKNPAAIRIIRRTLIRFMTISFQASPHIRPTVCTRNAITHAITHCMSTVAAAARALPSSRLTVAIAATQGV